MPEHMFDERTQNPFSIWHQDPILEGYIHSLIETVKPDRWVETGTHMGWTSMWIARNFPKLPIYTVEVDDRYYEKSKDNLAQFPQVTLIFGSSPTFLRTLVSILKDGLSMFWLDAHWWPPVPLREECSIVASLDKYVCLLDDFYCWEPFFAGDEFFHEQPNDSTYYNDLSYTYSALGNARHYRPIWKAKTPSKGVGLYLKGIDYTPPVNLMRAETLEHHLKIRNGKNPLHPSCK